MSGVALYMALATGGRQGQQGKAMMAAGMFSGMMAGLLALAIWSQMTPLPAPEPAASAFFGPEAP